MARMRCLLRLACFIALCITTGAEWNEKPKFDSPPSSAEDLDEARYGKLEIEQRAPPGVSEQDKRLKDVLEAKDYYIRIQPYFPAPGVTLPEGRNMTFDGVTTFKFKVKRATPTLTLYTFNLNYESIELLDSQGIKIETPRHTIDERLSHLIITPKSAPVVGETYLLQFKYTGTINPFQDGGLYYTYYVDVKGAVHWMVATHMENGYQARSVFPCLDEPAYKAVFHMTLIHPKTLIALSNTMEEPAVYEKPGWSVTRYPPTPRMSTYLVALAIGPFVSKSKVNEAGTLVRIWGWTGQDKYLDFAADVSAKCLYELGKYLDFPYPMTKSDQIGLPEFRAGAMENFGLIIYKYQYIAYNPKVHTTYEKQAAAGVMCHEIAHQWFGDIVTASWWSELVVNEGFANYFEIYNQANALPQQAFFLDSKFLIDMTQGGLDYDADLSRSHPIVVVPNGRYFDSITYDKGSSMYRMTHLTIGDEAFQEALRSYIHSYQYSNADHEMLFAKFTEAAQRRNVKDWCGRPLDVAKFLDPWFLQQPLIAGLFAWQHNSFIIWDKVNVAASEFDDGSLFENSLTGFPMTTSGSCFPLLTTTNNQLAGAGVTVTQQPYNKYSELPHSAFAYNYSWPVPLFTKNFKQSRGQSLRSWIKPDYDSNCGPRVQSLAAMSKGFNYWDYENANISAFARVQYDDVGYARLVNDLKANRDRHYDIADMIGILGDHVAFLDRNIARNESFSYKRVIELIKIIIPKNPRFGPFEVVRDVIDRLELLFEDGMDYELFQRFIKTILTDNYRQLGWTVTGSWDTDVARIHMLPYAVRYDITDSTTKGKKLFDGFRSACASSTTGVDLCSGVNPDLRKAVYCAGIKKGTSADFKFLLNMYKHQVANGFYFYQEYYAMLFGLSCTTSQDDLRTLIGEMFHTYRPNRRYKPFHILSRNPMASDVMAGYLIKNYKDIRTSRYFNEFMTAMIATWQTKTRLQQLEGMNEKLLPSMDHADVIDFKKIVDKLKAQVDWYNVHFRDIGHIFYDEFVKKGDEPFSERLPKDLWPLTYKAFIKPYFPSSAHYSWTKNMTFDSVMDMTVRVDTPTNIVNISVHRLLIQPADIVLRDGMGKVIQFTKAVKDFENGVMTISLPQKLQKGTTFSLHISSIGFIFYGPHEGAYTNFNYFEFNDKMAWIFSTDNEAGPDIRSVWPCFDEPLFKANWTVTIKHPSDMKALCNMPNEGINVDQNEFGWATTSFSQTPPIASYLVAMAVGHFAPLEKISKTGVLTRVWAWDGMEKYAQEGLDMAAGTIDFMTDMLEIDYALPKLDMVALPQYIIVSKALENWGIVCMLYETALVDPLYATSHDHTEVARVTPHEIVHQWFGNLVTSEWWSLIFLNEAFAQYYYPSGANYTYPSQEKYARFIRFWLADYALEHDGDPKVTRPIITDRKPIFTYAPYYKGASVLYMLNNAISPAVMEEGLRYYFKKNAWKTATEVDLWGAITEATKLHNIPGWSGDLNVQSLMDPWTKQENFPILKVRTFEQVVYTQEPFITEYDHPLDPSPYGYRWPIPVHSQMPGNRHEFRYFLTNETWRRPVVSTWRVENPGSVGTYRVWYDEKTWAPIREQLKIDLTVFDELTRAQFIGDAYALVKRGSLTWSRVLEMVNFVQNDVDYAPHFAFERVRHELLTGFKGTQHMPKIKKFVGKSFRAAYATYGWSSNTDWADGQLSNLATEGACMTGDIACLTKASDLFKKFLVNCEHSTTGTGLCNSEVHPDVRRTQYCYGLAKNAQGTDLVKKMYKWFMDNSHYFRKDEENLLNALACISDASIRHDLVSAVLSGTYPVSVLEYISLHDDDDTFLWNHFKSNIDSVVYGVPGFSQYMDYAVGTWNSQERMDELTTFLQSHRRALPQDDREVLENMKGKIRRNIKWMKDNGNSIITWIKKNIQ